MSADDSPRPQPTAHDLELPSNAIARRSFMRRVGVGAAAITAGTASSGTALAEDDDEDSSNWDYVRDGTNGVYMLLTGRYTTRAIANYQDKQDSALHAELYREAVMLEDDRQNAFDSIQNDLKMLSGWIRDNVANEVANVAAAGGDLDDMHDAVEDVVRDNIANTEQNLFNVWASDMQQVFEIMYDFYTGGDYSGDVAQEVIYATSYDGDGHQTDPLADNSVGMDNTDGFVFAKTEGSEGTVQSDNRKDTIAMSPEISLANGDSISLPGVGYANTAPITVLFPWASADPTFSTAEGFSAHSDWDDLYRTVVDRDADGSMVGSRSSSDRAITSLRVYPEPYNVGDPHAKLIDAEQFVDVHQSLLDLLEEELAHAETIVDNLGQAMLDGEVSYHDVASGQAVLDAAADLEDWNDAAMFFRQVNTPEGEHAAVVELESGVELQGALFWTAPDPDRGLLIGEWIEPEDELGEIHMGAEVHSLDEDDGDGWNEDWVGTTKLTEPFRINGLDGGHDGPLMFDETELPDPQDTEAMLERIRDAYEREREAEEDAEITINLDGAGGGGGGGDPLFDFDNPLDSDGAQYLGLGLIGVVVLAVIGIVTDLVPGLGD
ncbi:hypothetical protein [Natronorubrum sulfidifaciens]|uniref:hypothetical protein n=1 Tax=Natronorubrum sulfidifaciens TaxID=388259 RepID=UPI00126744C5|nr:hypothetical protein [Natronorubrum sulfidifaciens]